MLHSILRAAWTISRVSRQTCIHTYVRKRLRSRCRHNEIAVQNVVEVAVLHLEQGTGVRHGLMRGLGPHLKSRRWSFAVGCAVVEDCLQRPRVLYSKVLDVDRSQSG